MDEQRQNAYLNIIQSLLNCTRDEEAEIVRANQEWVDAGLARMMRQVIEKLTNKGDRSAAIFLIYLTGLLEKKLNYNYNSPPASKIYECKSPADFLWQVLPAIADAKSKGNLRIIHPMLQGNLHLINDELAKLLRLWAKTTLSNLSQERKKLVQFTAVIITDFCDELDKLFSQRSLGNYLQVAIAGYESALQILTPEESPEDWASIKIALATVYLRNIGEEWGENIEKGITCLQDILQVCTREEFPENWAAAQTNLAVAYRGSIQGDPKTNMEQALVCYQKALQVYTREDFPQKWGTVHFNLGTLYRHRIQGDNKANIERAIACYQKALQIYTSEDFPENWAGVQNNLGATYCDRLCGNRTKNLEQAITCLQNALQIYNREEFPVQWAVTQNNLGTAYNESGETYNPERAIACFQNALQIYNCENFPTEWVETLDNLSLSYQYCRQFQNEYDVLKSAIDTIEYRRIKIISGDTVKQKFAEKWNKIYRKMVKCCLNLGKNKEAIEYSERSKIRNLVELILERDIRTIFPSEVASKLEQLEREIINGQKQLQKATAERPSELAKHLQQLRQQRNELQYRYLPVGSSFNFHEFQRTLDNRTVIVEFYLTDKYLFSFMFTRQTQQPLVFSSEYKDRKKLSKWADRYLNTYYQKRSHWQRRLSTRLHLLAKILHIDEIIEQVPTDCDKLILIPHRYLHLLPLHALPLAGNTSLFDRFTGGVSYAPSCQLLQLAQTRQRPEFTHLLAVQNPTGDLAYTDIEVEVLQHYFNTTNIFKKDLATREAINSASLNAAHCVHFGCHGYFNGTYPRKSALLLADAKIDSLPPESNEENYLNLQNGSVFDLSKCLTLDAIFDRNFNLECCRLVVLSACETGLIDWNNISDEYIGLPSGFIYAGAFIVISSLWKVNDVSTAFLMIRFYQNLQKGLTVTLALNQAQLWLKNLTKSDLSRWIEENKLQLKPAVRMSLRRRFYKLENDAKPFQSPFYWAGFCAIGGD